MLETMIDIDEDKALVLGFYGVGQGPKATKLYNVLKDAKNKKTEIVLMSQCQKGYVDIKSKKEGNNNESFDEIISLVMNGSDMTVEAVVTKLSYLMGKGLRGQKLKKQFENNLRGEMTPIDEMSNNIINILH